MKVLLSSDQIQARILEMGQQIAADYKGAEPLLVGVLKGACPFMTDLAQAIDLPLTLDYIAVSSYGKATKSSGEVKLVKDLDQGLDGRDVHAGGKQGPDRAHDRLAIGAASEMHVEPVELAETREAPLRGGDIGERGKALQLGDAVDLELDHAFSHHERQAAAAELARGDGRQEHPVRREQLRPSEAQRVNADHTHGPLGTRDSRVQLQHGIHPRDAGEARDLREKGLREAAAAAANLQVRLSRQRAHRRRKVRHGGPVHEVHAVAERHAERDAGNGKRGAAAGTAPAKDRQKAQHAD